MSRVCVQDCSSPDTEWPFDFLDWQRVHAAFFSCLHFSLRRLLTHLGVFHTFVKIGRSDNSLLAKQSHFNCECSKWRSTCFQLPVQVETGAILLRKWQTNRKLPISIFKRIISFNDSQLKIAASEGIHLIRKEEDRSSHFHLVRSDHMPIYSRTLTHYTCILKYY